MGADAETQPNHKVYYFNSFLILGLYYDSFVSSLDFFAIFCDNLCVLRFNLGFMYFLSRNEDDHRF